MKGAEAERPNDFVAPAVSPAAIVIHGDNVIWGIGADAETATRDMLSWLGVKDMHKTMRFAPATARLAACVDQLGGSIVFIKLPDGTLDLPDEGGSS